MTLFEHIFKADFTGKAVYQNEQGQIVVDKAKFSKLECNDNNYVGIITTSILVRKAIWPDARYENIAPCKMPSEVRERVNQNIITIPDKLIQQIKHIEVVVDPETRGMENMARKPYYRIRGRSVTPEQAMDIIRCTDWAFTWGDAQEAKASDSVDSWNFVNCWIITSHSHTSRFGWVHPNGLIGTNSLTGDKNPDYESFFAEALGYKLAFPYLDMMIAVTDWNEQPEYAWEAEDCDYIEVDDSSFYDFLEHLVYGVVIHDNVIEVIGPSKARAIYQEYVKKYGIEDTSRYVSAYGMKGTDKYDQEQYSKQCFVANGADAESVFNK